MRLLRVLLPLVVLALAALAAPAQAHHERTARPVALTAVEERLLEAINRYRVEQGVRPLLPSLHLQAAARFYADDLAAHDNVTLAHLDSRGQLPHDRFARFGYPAPRSTGENVAAGELDPERTLQQWIDSAPHHQTLVADEWTVLGVAVGGNPDSSSGNYWVASFGMADDALQTAAIDLALDLVAPLEPRVVVGGCRGRGEVRRCAPGRALSLRAEGGRGRTGLQVQQRRGGGRWRTVPAAAGRHVQVLGRGQVLRVRGRATSGVGESVGPWIELRAGAVR